MRARSNARCSATTNPQASLPGEVIPSREFYDYEAKYLDEGSRTIIPADLPDELVAEVRRLAIEAFRAIDAAGMSRVDFLLSRTSGALFVNEINTIPGFTTISMYLEDVGSDRRELSGAGRSPHSAGARTARREAAPAHQRVIVSGSRSTPTPNAERRALVARLRTPRTQLRRSARRTSHCSCVLHDPIRQFLVSDVVKTIVDLRRAGLWVMSIAIERGRFDFKATF